MSNNDKDSRKNASQEQMRRGFPKIYTGQYRDLLNNVFQKTWLAVLYVVCTTALVYFLGGIHDSLTLFIVLQLPFILTGSYVLWPNPNIRYRVPIGWTTTALLLYLTSKFEQLNRVSSHTSSEFKTWQQNILIVSYSTTILIICILVYSMYIGIAWTYKSLKGHSSKSEISIFLAMWGATLQMVQIAAKLVLPYIKPIISENDVGRNIIKIGETSLSYSIFGFVPISLFLIGTLIFVSFSVSEDPYKPISLVDFMSVKNASSLYDFIKIVLVPLWIIFIILGFVAHLLVITVRVLIEFTENYIPRVIFIVISLVLGPTSFFVGHESLMISMKKIIDYMSVSEMSEKINTQSLIMVFLLIHGHILLALSIYFASICLITLRYRGETPKQIVSAVFQGIFGEGKEAAIAVTQVFSLTGILILIVPIAALIPGGPGFGAFSWVYTAIMTIMAIWTYTRPMIIAKLQKKSATK